MRFNTPTPIQSAAIPVALTGKDVVATAQTGTGKTAAFLIPAIHRVLNDKTLKVLILTPTRELAQQIQDVLRSLTRDSRDIRSAVLIGGASMNPQIHALRANPQFVIATPGRLQDHMRRRSIRMDMQIFVLDEVDRMLDMGFSVPVQEIVDALPKDKQTLLFSATLPESIQNLVRKHTREPQEIRIGSTNTPHEKIQQSHVEVDFDTKNIELSKMLKDKALRTLVFARTKHRTDRLARFLKTENIKCAAIHGGRSQNQRQEALRGFQSGRYHILVATDVASRGIDVTDIQLVVNFDLPETREDYIHRIGRTARGEALSGEAISFVSPEELSHWRMISSSERQKFSGRPSRRPQGPRRAPAQRRGGFREVSRDPAKADRKSFSFRFFKSSNRRKESDHR